MLAIILFTLQKNKLGNINTIINNMRNIPLYERNICIFANKKTAEELKKIDWNKICSDIVITPLIIGIFKLGSRFLKNKGVNPYKKEVPYNILDIDKARQAFKFPPSHPQNGIVYATSEIDDLTYVPLASFHKYMYESKMASFTELCSSLGAKSCNVIYAEENGKDITSKIKLDNIPTSNGILSGQVNVGYNDKNSQKADVFLKFPKPNSIKEYKSAWLHGEPTWKALQKIRLENDLERYNAEFNYDDEMGITAEIATSLAKIGVNIGGSYEVFKRTKYKFAIEFWEKP